MKSALPRTKTLSRRELVDLLARNSIASKREIDVFLHVLFEEIRLALSEGTTVQLGSFGSFITRERQTRKVRVPKTGRLITVRASQVPVFRPGKFLREALS